MRPESQTKGLMNTKGNGGSMSKHLKQIAVPSSADVVIALMGPPRTGKSFAGGLIVKLLRELGYEVQFNGHVNRTAFDNSLSVKIEGLEGTEWKKEGLTAEVVNWNELPRS